jgi:hypothetical protein
MPHRGCAATIRERPGTKQLAEGVLIPRTDAARQCLIAIREGAHDEEGERRWGPIREGAGRGGACRAAKHQPLADYSATRQFAPGGSHSVQIEEYRRADGVGSTARASAGQNESPAPVWKYELGFDLARVGPGGVERPTSRESEKSIPRRNPSSGSRILHQASRPSEVEAQQALGLLGPLALTALSRRELADLLRIRALLRLSQRSAMADRGNPQPSARNPRRCTYTPPPPSSIRNRISTGPLAGIPSVSCSAWT